MNWKEIWNNKNSTNTKINLQNLIALDGFDTGFGTIKVNDWITYITMIKEKMHISKTDSIYEVGCGSGAFLYPFYNDNHLVGGFDFSKSLINIAKEMMPQGKFEVLDAIEFKQNQLIDEYDYVISNGVFFYFPSYDYAQNVLKEMLKVAKKGVAILEVPDLEKKELALSIRKKNMSSIEYKKKYSGLDHLYFSKEWFKNFGYDVKIENQEINNYPNSEYRFNVFISK